MRGLIAATLIPLAVVVAAGQEKEPAKPSNKAETTLTGCVSTKPDPTGTYMLTQESTGGRFRLIGKSMRDFAGKPVEIVSVKGLSIRTGLTPSVNVAAQAGHIDSAQAAIANQPGATTGKSDADLPEIRVSRVREVSGTCK